MIPYIKYRLLDDSEQNLDNSRCNNRWLFEYYIPSPSLNLEAEVTPLSLEITSNIKKKYKGIHFRVELICGDI